MTLKEYYKGVYYCKKCNKLYKEAYDLSDVIICRSCWSEDIQFLSEKEIKPFIRKKRLENIKNISENE